MILRRRKRREPDTLDTTRVDRFLSTHWPFTTLRLTWVGVAVWAALTYGLEGWALILLAVFGTFSTSLVGFKYAQRNGYRRGYLRGIEPTGDHGSPQHEAHFKAVRDYR